MVNKTKVSILHNSLHLRCVRQSLGNELHCRDFFGLADLHTAQSNFITIDFPVRIILLDKSQRLLQETSQSSVKQTSYYNSMVSEHTWLEVNIRISLAAGKVKVR